MSDAAPDYGALALRDELVEDEGYRPYLYQDTDGNLSGGIGHNFSANGLSPEAIDFIFQEDERHAVEDLDRNLPWWRTIPAQQQRVVINLCFNLGIAKFLLFPVFLGAMKRQDWSGAAASLQDSAWFRQVGLRGPRMLARIRASDPIA